MKKVVRAEKILDKLVLSNSITQDGRDWLTLALDPFHDMDHAVAGYPDSDTSRTVVSCYQYAADFSKPAGVTTSTWDAHVFSLPFAKDAGDLTMYDGATSAGAGVYTPDVGTVGKTRNLINVEINNAGSSLFPTSHAEAVAGTRSVVSLPTPVTYWSGTSSRILGMGFEIVDTTADVYKQGALTAYRMPQMPSLTQQAYQSAAMEGTIEALRYRTPPSSPAQAMLLSGTRQWLASEGAYVVCTQSSVLNPMCTDSSTGIMLVGGNFRSAYAELGTHNAVTVNAPPAASVLYSTPTVHFPFNTSGVMLTGLNANSTFRVKVKIYVEQAPLPYQNDLVVLATPSAPYDPVALEAYSKALTHVPVAVVAGDNSFGDWFAGVADVLSKVALPISAALTPVLPAAPVIGAAVTTAAMAAKNIIGGQKKNDNVVPKPQTSALQNPPKQVRNPPMKKDKKEKKN